MLGKDVQPHPEWQYLNTLSQILENGERVENRTGVDTYRILGVTHRYNFSDGFPLFTTKRVWFKGVAHELLWFLKGSTNIKYLVDNGVNIWTDDAYRTYLKTEGNPPHDHTLSKEQFVEYIKNPPDVEGYKGLGELGPVYGSQWRQWRVPAPAGIIRNEVWQVDQVARLVDNLKNNPSSRRHILSAWNVGEIQDMGLPPCHVMSQYTISKGKLWCHMYQRSCDMFLGVPFNVASYSLLTYMLAQVCGLEPGGLIHTMHDCHVYANHEDAVKEQLTRVPGKFPKLLLNPEVDNIDNFTYNDFSVVDYNPCSTIKAELNT